MKPCKRHGEQDGYWGLRTYNGQLLPVWWCRICRRERQLRDDKLAREGR